jgi:type 1 fimbria pilin
MATRKVLIGFAAGLFVAGGIAMLAGPAYAQQVSIQVDAKKTIEVHGKKTTSTCKINVDCQSGVCKGTVDKAPIDRVSYADPNPGSISFYQCTGGPACLGVKKLAEWDVPDPAPKSSTRVFCIATGFYEPTAAQIRGRIENQP